MKEAFKTKRHTAGAVAWQGHGFLGQHAKACVRKATHLAPARPLRLRYDIAFVFWLLFLSVH
jgi:hypothetical protein